MRAASDKRSSSAIPQEQPGIALGALFSSKFLTTCELTRRAEKTSQKMENLTHSTVLAATHPVFALMSFKVKGMNVDQNSQKSFKALDTLLFDGEKSRLHSSLITDQTKEFGVQSVGGFSELDREFGEYHIVLQGSDLMLTKIDSIKACIAHALLKSPNQIENERCKNAIQFKSSTEHINVDSLTSAWIDDFKLTQNFDNYWTKGDGWKSGLTNRMNEIHAILDPLTNVDCCVVAYSACTPEECAVRQKELQEKREHFKDLLSNEEHRRTSSLEVPKSFYKFRSRFANVSCKAPHEPFMTKEGVWTHVSNPKFELVKVGIRPCQHYLLERSGDIVELNLLVDVMKEAFPQDRFNELGIRGAFSGSMCVVASYSPEKSNAFREWVDTFASQLTQDRQKLIAQKFSERRDFFESKWTSENKERRMDVDTNISEYISQRCSDSYYIHENGFESLFDMYEQSSSKFDIGHAFETWNCYWGDTTQLITQADAAACEFEPAESRKVELNKPRNVSAAKRGEPAHVIQINPDMNLNQSVVTIARTGSTNKSNMDYWCVQTIAQTILFHSLGSRLYKLREERGLFYSAYGSFSTNSSHECNGYDFIQAKVNPGSEEDMIDTPEFDIANIKLKHPGDARAGIALLISCTVCYVLIFFFKFLFPVMAHAGPLKYVVRPFGFVAASQEEQARRERSAQFKKGGATNLMDNFVIERRIAYKW